MVPPRTRGLPWTGGCASSIRGRHVYTDLDPSPRRLVCRQVFIFGTAVLGLFAASSLLRQQEQPQQWRRWQQLQQGQQQQQQQQGRQPYGAGPEARVAKSVPPQAAAATAAIISLWNSYSLEDTAVRVDRLYPWSYLAEPYKTSVLTIETLEHGFETSVRCVVLGNSRHSLLVGKWFRSEPNAAICTVHAFTSTAPLWRPVCI